MVPSEGKTRGGLRLGGQEPVYCNVLVFGSSSSEHRMRLFRFPVESRATLRARIDCVALCQPHSAFCDDTRCTDLLETDAPH